MLCGVCHPKAERQALAREFKIEKALMLGTNYGIAYGFNSLFFRLCAAPYFLTLEEALNCTFLQLCAWSSLPPILFWNAPPSVRL